ncbi:MAG: hypothetical protein JXB07_12580 [Anaerolineae bacterium]|nr:hypothetical protein [Anaerolineae bacterium]
MATLIYWILLPERVRHAGLLFFSIVALIASGATVWFILLVVTLTLATQVAGRQQNETSASFSPGLILISLIYIATMIVSLLWAALWIGEHGYPDILSLPLAWDILCFDLVLQSGILFLAWGAVICLFALALAAIEILRQAATADLRRVLGYFVVLSLLGAFIALKLQPLNLPGLVTWVGFSYFSFRLLHVLLDSFNGQFTNASPLEILVYALFFPALLIGPIDRLPRFLKDMRGEVQTFQWLYVVEGMTRILIGGVKKFFLADLLLSKLALGLTLSAHTQTGFAWVQLYAYALYIFFDFAGYTDIAIGTGRMLGVSLPENFMSPYLKPSITSFWQAWHITLSSWLRDYVFFPISRYLLQTRGRRHSYVILFLAHMTTMILIGLWHGISLNFVIWGVWHGAGLFVHKIFTDRTRSWQLYWQKHPLIGRVVDAVGVLVTFHFVMLGWVFFVLQNSTDSMIFMLRLFGISS